MMHTYVFLYGVAYGYVDADTEEEASDKVVDEMGRYSDDMPLILPVESGWTQYANDMT